MDDYHNNEDSTEDEITAKDFDEKDLGDDKDSCNFGDLRELLLAFHTQTNLIRLMTDSEGNSPPE